MTATDSPSHRSNSSAARRRGISVVAGAMVAAMGVAAIATSGGGAAGAATTYKSAASGRFLSGSVAGQSLDTLVGIAGEAAQNNGGPRVVHQNSLNAELLNGALKIPLPKGLQLPGLNVLHLGAVAQYAEANNTGKAIGAAGAVSSSGGIGVGGVDGVPPADATLDLSGLGGAELAKRLANLKLTVGAISARADQKPGANGEQSGQYNIASLRLELDVPILADLLKPVLDTLGPVLTTLQNTIDGLSLGGVISVTIPSLSDLVNQLSQMQLANGAISVDLTTGTVVIDLAKLLQSLGLDLNNLPPNTSLVPYLVKALGTTIPAAVQSLVDGLVADVNALLGGITVTVGGTAINITTGPVATVIKAVSDNLSTLLKTVLSSLSDIANAAGPIGDLLDQLVSIIVNGQSTSGDVFTERAVQINLLNLSGLSLPPLPGAATLPTNKIKIVQADVREAGKKADTEQPAKSTPSSSETPNSIDAVRLHAGAARPAAMGAHLAAARAASPLVQLNLATATVGPSSPIAAPTSSPTPVPTTPTTAIPTGVPAGSGSHGTGVVLPLVLLLLGLAIAGGGVFAYRTRGRYTE